MKSRRCQRYSITEVEYIRDNYRFVSNAIMAKVLARPKEGLKKFLQENNFYRSQEELKSLVTELSLRLNAHGLPVYWVKVGEKWMEYHKFIWRKNGYRIPQFNDLIFLNRKFRDVRISNLTLKGKGYDGAISKANEVRRENRINSPELKAERKEYWNHLLARKEAIRKERYQQKLEEAEKKRKEKEERKRLREQKWSKEFLNDQIKTMDTTTGKKAVKVDSRTTIFVDRSISNEEAIEQFKAKQAKRNEQFKIGK